jgi:hypothetical protein
MLAQRFAIDAKSPRANAGPSCDRRRHSSDACLLASGAMPVHRDRSRVQEARISGLAIMLSVAALVLVLGYVVGGYANRVVVQVVFDPSPAASTR